VAAPAPRTVDDVEEYAVWAAVLTQFVADQVASGETVDRVVLADRTDVSAVGDIRRRVELGGYRMEGGKKVIRLSPLAGLEDATMDDFQTRNAEPLVLGDFFRLPRVLVNFISAAQLGQLLQRGDGWKAFYRRYPGAGGLVTVSRVGFNEARTAALVYVGVQTHGLGGWGVLSLFWKDKGVWRKQGEQRLWLS
jgi:hypothetical protein